jgi:hypothetical protein
MDALSEESHLSDRLVFLDRNLPKTGILNAVVRQRVRLPANSRGKILIHNLSDSVDRDAKVH